MIVAIVSNKRRIRVAYDSNTSVFLYLRPAWSYVSGPNSPKVLSFREIWENSVALIEASTTSHNRFRNQFFETLLRKNKDPQTEIHAWTADSSPIFPLIRVLNPFDAPPNVERYFAELRQS